MLRSMLPDIKNPAILVRTRIELDENKKGLFTEIELREIEKIIENNKEIILARVSTYYI